MQPWPLAPSVVLTPSHGRCADVYVYCSPTRSSFMTGRLPYHVNQINISPYLPGSGAARNMVRSKSLATIDLGV